MFRAEILWLASGPTLKLEGKLVADWAQQAECLVTKDVLPKGLLVDITEVSYVDSAGEQLLNWLASVGAVFIAGSVYAFAVCDRLRLPLMQRIVERRKRLHERGRERSSIKGSHPVKAVEGVIERGELCPGFTRVQPQSMPAIVHRQPKSLPAFRIKEMS
jgi:hypothetical protein